MEPSIRSKIYEMDIVRALAILAVVLIHSTSDATIEPTVGSLSRIMFYAINRACQFAVPLFIMISGLVLFYHYYYSWNYKSAFTFYQKRICSVVIPYVVWSFFYYLFYQYISKGEMGFNFHAFFKLAQWGEIGYHLYFMVLILQFYLLFPLLITLAKKWVWFRQCLIPLGLLIQGTFYLSKHEFMTIQHESSLSPTYFAYFLIGGFLGIYYTNFKSWMKKNILWVMVIAILSGAVYVEMLLKSQYSHLIFENSLWYEISILLYAVTTGVSFLWLGCFLLNNSFVITPWLISISSCSFGIYLVHPFLLSLYKIFFKPPGAIWPYNLYTMISFIVVFLGAWALSYVYRKLMKIIKESKTHQNTALQDQNG